MISLEDRMMIHELLSWHGHLVDDGQLDALSHIFSPDVVYDLQDYGFGVLHGTAAIRDSARTLGDANPVGHHVTNIVLTEGEDEQTVHARSKGIGITSDGSCGSVTYEDIIKKQHDKWHIVYRKVIARRTPLGGL